MVEGYDWRRELYMVIIKNVIKIYIKVVKICVYTQINLKTVSFINFYNIIIKQ